MISASLKAFLDQLVDYAGLFPPAGLPLEASLENYLSYRNHPMSSMLGRFVIPVSRLGDLERSNVLSEGTWRLALLGSPVEDPVAAVRQAESDLEAIGSYLGTYLGGSARVETVEIPVAAAILPELGKLAQKQAEIYGQVGKLQIFYEISLGELRPSVYQSLSDAGAGLKLRLGGAMVPAFTQLADVLRAWAAYGVGLKATAGLHQALPHEENHGFVSFFAAAMLARRHQLSRADLLGVLKESHARSFQFDEQGLLVRDLRLTTAELRELREMVCSFGSCSFLEPVESLVEKGFLALAA